MIISMSKFILPLTIFIFPLISVIMTDDELFSYGKYNCGQYKNEANQLIKYFELYKRLPNKDLIKKFLNLSKTYYEDINRYISIIEENSFSVDQFNISGRITLEQSKIYCIKFKKLIETIMMQMLANDQKMFDFWSEFNPSIDLYHKLQDWISDANDDGLLKNDINEIEKYLNDEKKSKRTCEKIAAIQDNFDDLHEDLIQKVIINDYEKLLHYQLDFSYKDRLEINTCLTILGSLKNLLDDLTEKLKCQQH